MIMPNHDWQIPISCQGRNFAHYFLRSTKQAMVPALCGYKVNPAFAEDAGKARRCKTCERKLDEQGS